MQESIGQGSLTEKGDPVTPPWSTPRIWRLEEAGSCLDTAFWLASHGLLRQWDSVQTGSQSCGRGQLRRHWHSPRGNVYAALRLPLSGPFAGTAAAPWIGFLLADALCELGWPVLLKWPNDLVLTSTAGPRKVAGILLEERGKTLVAGIGINLYHAPDASQMREGAALPATALAAGQGGPPPPLPEELWQMLVMQIFSAYKKGCCDFGQWQERLLLWRGCQVRLKDAGHEVCGRLEGLAPDGAIRLRVDGLCREWLNGSLYLSGSLS